LQVVVVFFFNMVAGTFIYQYNTIINDPRTVITALGTAIPQTSTFFITYILTSGATNVEGCTLLMTLIQCPSS
jgi:hypothetical protein